MVSWLQPTSMAGTGEDDSWIPNLENVPPKTWICLQIGLPKKERIGFALLTQFFRGENVRAIFFFFHQSWFSLGVTLGRQGAQSFSMRAVIFHWTMIFWRKSTWVCRFLVVLKPGELVEIWDLCMQCASQCVSVLLTGKTPFYIQGFAINTPCMRGF